MLLSDHKPHFNLQQEVLQISRGGPGQTHTGAQRTARRPPGPTAQTQRGLGQPLLRKWTLTARLEATHVCVSGQPCTCVTAPTHMRAQPCTLTHSSQGSCLSSLCLLIRPLCVKRRPRKWCLGAQAWVSEPDGVSPALPLPPGWAGRGSSVSTPQMPRRRVDAQGLSTKLCLSDPLPPRSPVAVGGFKARCPLPNASRVLLSP